MENSYDFGYCFFLDRISTDTKDVPGLSGHGGADFYCIGSFIEAIAVCINYINILLDWNVCFERDNCGQRCMEWLLFNTKWANCQLYHGEKKFHFDEIMSTLY